MDKVKLKELVDIYLGVTHTPEYVLSGVPFLSVKDISNGAISFDNCKYISEAEYNSLSEGAKPKVGDMLFCRVGTLGKPIIIPEGTPLFGSFVSLGYLRNKNPEKCNMNYLRYWMNSSAFWHQVQANVKGASQVNLNTGWLSKFDVVLPDFEEQAYRITILDECSKIIKKRNDQLKSLDELIKARFVELFDNKYPTVILGDVIKTTSGGTPSKAHPEYYDGGTIPWLSSGEVNAGVITSVKNYITEEGMKHSSAKMVPKDSVVVAMYGATAGVTGILRLDTTTNQAVCSLLPTERFIPEFLYHAVASKKEWMISQCQGGGQPNISQGIIKSMELIDAPIDDQKRFAQFVTQADKSKVAVQKSLDEAQLLFDSLMQQYFG